MNRPTRKFPALEGESPALCQGFAPRRQIFRRMRAGCRAFSLVELLVVVAVIGVLAAMALPNFANIAAAARTARDQRNAQTVVSLTSAAREAGFTGDWGSKSNAITLLVAGISITNVTHANQVFSFRIDSLTPANQASAANYLLLSGSNIIYMPGGGQTN